MTDTRKPETPATPAKPVGMKLPDPKSFVVAPIKMVDDGPDPGTVLDLDYGKWAPAIVDLAAKPERVDKSRHRLQQRGYQKIEGEVTVVGFRKAEVWVLPRDMYNDLTRQKRERLRQRVISGSLSDMALVRPKVTYMAKGGKEIPVDY